MLTLREEEDAAAEHSAPAGKPGSSAGSSSGSAERGAGNSSGSVACGTGDSSRAGSTKPPPQRTRYSLRRKARFWATFVQSSLVMAWLTAGVQMSWGTAGPPPPTRLPNHSSAEAHASFVDDAIQALLHKGAIELASNPPAVVSPLSVIERRGKLRLVIDLSLVNEYCVAPPRFKYETISTASEVFQPGDWMFSVDLEAASLLPTYR